MGEKPGNRDVEKKPIEVELNIEEILADLTTAGSHVADNARYIEEGVKEYEEATQKKENSSLAREDLKRR